LLVIVRRRVIPIKILIVDDEDTILEEAAETLTDEGYDCVVASNVKAAVVMINTTPGIALVLTDLRMPGGTGADLIKIVETTLEQKIKFIVMSGHAHPTIEKNGIDLSFYPFLKKPLNIETLIEKVKLVLEST
jgi:DNA-binding NtrC family response regulator